MRRTVRTHVFSVVFPLIRPGFRSLAWGVLMGVLLLSCACARIPPRAGQELENVPGAYTFSQGSTDYPHLYRLAVEHLEKNEYSQAETVYREIIEKEPDQVNGYIGLGTSLNLQGRHQEAREAYEAALGMVPDSVEALVGLAAAYFRQGLYPQAADTYRQALALNPKDANAHYGLAAVLVVLGEQEEAIEHYEQVMELAPNSGLAAEAGKQLDVIGQEGD